MKIPPRPINIWSTAPAAEKTQNTITPKKGKNETDSSCVPTISVPDVPPAARDITFPSSSGPDVSVSNDSLAAKTCPTAGSDDIALGRLLPRNFG